MKEIELRGMRPATLLPTREEKQHLRAKQAIVWEAQEQALKGDASAALTGRSMELTTELAKQAKMLAGDDPMLLPLLYGFVGSFASGAQRRQREFDAGFRL